MFEPERRQSVAVHDVIHHTTDIGWHIETKRVESTHIIKGGAIKDKKRFCWTGNDRKMFFGLLPVNIAPGKKKVLESMTLFFVVVSVLLIIIQSYPAFDPHCIPEWRAPSSDDDDGGGTVLKRYYSCSSRNKNTNATGYYEMFYAQTGLVVWFTIEYALRFLAVRPSWKVKRPYSRKDFMAAKVKHVLSFMTVIDFLAISYVKTNKQTNKQKNKHVYGAVAVIIKVTSVKSQTLMGPAHSNSAPHH